MPQQAVAVLRNAYSHVEDVDLYTGGLVSVPRLCWGCVGVVAMLEG